MGRWRADGKLLAGEGLQAGEAGEARGWEGGRQVAGRAVSGQAGRWLAGRVCGLFHIICTHISTIPHINRWFLQVFLDV